MTVAFGADASGVPALAAHLSFQAERSARRRLFWSYGGVLAFALFTAILILGHAGLILNYAFPLLAASLAGTLFVYRRPTYFAFTWWIWLFSPEVRRFVDFQTHYHTISPVMLSPLLVTVFALIAVIRRPRILLRRKLVPFGLVALVTAYAFAVGVAINGFVPAAFELGNWLEPLSFGVLLIMDSNGAQNNRQALVSAMIIGLIIVGAYGLYQFFHLPAWDAAWLTNSNLHSQGSALALMVRIFGPLNDSGTFGAVVATSLAFVLVSKGYLRIAAGAIGFPALLLAEVRQYWGVFALSTIIVIWGLGGKARLRTFVIALVVASIAIPILSVGPVATLVSKRFTSITNIQSDSSSNARKVLYARFVVTSITQPIGAGFGSFGGSAKLAGGDLVDFDSGILAIPYLFGWVGSLVFVWALGQISVRILTSYLRSKNPIMIAASAVFFSMLAVLLFGQVFVGVEGMVVWTAAGLALSMPIPGQGARGFAK